LRFPLLGYYMIDWGSVFMWALVLDAKLPVTHSWESWKWSISEGTLLGQQGCHALFVFLFPAVRYMETFMSRNCLINVTKQLVIIYDGLSWLRSCWFKGLHMSWLLSKILPDLNWVDRKTEVQATKEVCTVGNWNNRDLSLASGSWFLFFRKEYTFKSY
jgi:hypothetical protein